MAIFFFFFFFEGWEGLLKMFPNMIETTKRGPSKTFQPRPPLCSSLSLSLRRDLLVKLGGWGSDDRGKGTMRMQKAKGWGTAPIALPIIPSCLLFFFNFSFI